jgi:hypothetical protein
VGDTQVKMRFLRERKALLCEEKGDGEACVDDEGGG